MRELRVIESCVEYLHVPFACGAFDFEKITQEQSITKLISLVYKLLMKIIENYPNNEMYSSQWISLFLAHVLKTNSKNQIGADSFVTQLVDQNIKILQEQVKP